MKLEDPDPSKGALVQKNADEARLVLLLYKCLRRPEEAVWNCSERPSGFYKIMKPRSQFLADE